MDGASLPGHRNLDAMYQADTNHLSLGLGLGEALQGVVIGQGQRPDPAFSRTRNQGRGRKDTIRCRGMTVEIKDHAESFGPTKIRLVE